MSLHIYEEIKSLFETYLKDEDGLYPSGWKHIVTRLQRIANLDPNSPFDANARSGFNYLEIVVMNSICDKCGDTKAFKWMKEFARAWLAGTELPEFCHSCWTNEE